MKSLIVANEFIWPETGIGKKLINQHRALHELTESCEMVRLKLDEGLCKRYAGDTPVDIFGTPKYGYIQALFQYQGLLNYIKENEIGFLYIRYVHFANHRFLDFLRAMKGHGVTVVLEIPTYPYDSEGMSRIDISRIKHVIELIYREKLGRWIDAIVTFSDDKKIFGSRCINISNAADPHTLPLSCEPGECDHALHFVAVANLAFWHGYDRLISSMGRHYRERTNPVDIHFHLVGNGAELAGLKALAETQGVSRYVKFYGALGGQELDRVFDLAHIGVDSLGRHRSGNRHNNSLKSKEYLMRGLPLIKSHLDHSIDDSGFQFQVAAEDEPFPLETIAHWYRDNGFRRAAIRNYALAHFTWIKQMRHVLEHCTSDTAH